MSFWVYILRCADGSYYTGHTDNLEQRVYQHHAGAIASCYTYKRRPLQLVFSQDFPTREEALASEQQIKGWGRKKKEAMMCGDWDEVSRLAKSSMPVRPDSFDLAQDRLFDLAQDSSFNLLNAPQNSPIPVRPELVEGLDSSVHATSTSSGQDSTVRPFDTLTTHGSPRTDGDISTFLQTPSPVRPELVEGLDSSVHGSTGSPRTEGKVPP